MCLKLLGCVAVLAAAYLASLFASPRALRCLSAWLLAQACTVEYLYPELKSLADRAAYVRRGELQFYREQLDLDKPRQELA